MRREGKQRRKGGEKTGEWEEEGRGKGEVRIKRGERKRKGKGKGVGRGKEGGQAGKTKGKGRERCTFKHNQYQYIQGDNIGKTLVKKHC